MFGSFSPRLLFGVSGRVSRQQYLIAGVALMLLKYAMDASAMYWANGEIFTPLQYVNPQFTAREEAVGEGPKWILLLMLGWSLPFIWVGVSMTLRRARDAGLSVWIAMLFFVPVVNWVLMVVLAVLPARVSVGREERGNADAASGFAAALQGIAVSALIAGAMIPLAVYGKGDYGMTLFLGTPFVQGVVTAHFFNRGQLRSAPSNFLVITSGVLIVAGCVLLVALEGAICLMMAMPLAWGSAVMGMFLGRLIAKARQSPAGTVSAVILLPVLAVAEPAPPTEVFEVSSSVQINAPPQEVWNHLVAVSELPAPHERFFRLGIAYPQRAVIDGSGVGAVRRCEFSTGAFVEPVTRWDEPRKLSFDVASQPPPMHEWSPYRHVHPPHLDGYFRSVRGEFRLVPTASGTRLEGSTWYELDILPRAYWRQWSDLLIGSIHVRVLRHIKVTTEASRADDP